MNTKAASQGSQLPELGTLPDDVVFQRYVLLAGTFASTLRRRTPGELASFALSGLVLPTANLVSIIVVAR